jgi:transketolase C-terminal domain/subunit
MAQQAPSTGGSARTLTMARAGREAVIAEMRKDPNIFVIGEDVAKLGGVFGTTVGMAEEFGAHRVIDTPISETGFIGIATGAAMAGMRPIVEIAFVDFIGVCFNAIFNFAAKTHYMSGGQFKVPMTMMIGYGGGYNDAAQHSQCLIGTLAHVPGIRIVTPADAHDAKGLMHSCLRDDNLTIWMVHKAIWGLGWLGTAIKTAMATVPEEEYTVPFGKARIWREGTDVTSGRVWHYRAPRSAGSREARRRWGFRGSARSSHHRADGSGRDHEVGHQDGPRGRGGRGLHELRSDRGSAGDDRGTQSENPQSARRTRGESGHPHSVLAAHGKLRAPGCRQDRGGRESHAQAS